MIASTPWRDRENLLTKVKRFLNLCFSCARSLYMRSRPDILAYFAEFRTDLLLLVSPWTAELENGFSLGPFKPMILYYYIKNLTWAS